ncbi:MAG: T9SS type A sorting domain-containing protein [Candidatus Cloacimonadales bacterium]
MRRLILVLLLLTITISTWAIIEWDINGAAVHQSSNAILEPASLITADGNLVTFWSDTRNGYRELYAQKLDAAGNKFWAEEGVLIGSHPGYVYNLVAVANPENEIVLAYLSSSPDQSSNQLYLQKLSAAGEKYWGESGRLIDGDYFISQPQLLLQADGSTTVAWKDNSQNQVKAARLNFNGTVANGWGADFQQTTQIGIDIIDVTRDYALTGTSADGIMLASNLGSDIYFQKMNLAGEKLFGSLGSLALTETAEIQAIDLQEAADNYYLAWRLNSASEQELHLLKFDAEANWLWADSEIISEQVKDFHLVIDSAALPVIAWRNYVTDLLAQKFSAEGEKIWDENGILLDTDLATNERFEMKAKNEVSYLTYITADAENSAQNKLQKISAQGELLYGEQAITLRTFQNNQFPENSSLAVAEEDIFFSWNELEAGASKIKLQSSDLAGNLQIAEEDQTVFGALYGSVEDYQLQAAAGLPLFSWLDNRNGESQIFVQRLTDSGLPIFTENGLALSADDVEDYDIAFNPENNFTAAVWNAREALYTIKSSGLDLNGNLLWEDLQLFSDDNDYAATEPVINAWGDDFLVAYSQAVDFSFSQVVAHKISAGELVWGEAGVIIADIEVSNLHIVDIYEDYIFYESDYWNDNQIFAQRLTATGEIYPGWPENGINLNSETNNSHLTNYQISPTPLGLLVSWYNYQTSALEIQLVQPNSDLYWPEPLSFPVDPIFEDYQISYNQGIYLSQFISETNDGSSLTIQKISLEGEELWPEPAEIFTTNNLRNFQQINLADNLVLIWEEQDTENLNYVKFQEIRPNGDLVYATNGVNLFGNTGFSSRPQIVFGGEYAYAACIDSKSIKYLPEYGLDVAQNLYAQKLSLETLSAESELNTLSNNLHNYPNPFSPSSNGRATATTLSYNLPQDVTKAAITIYNLKGQKITQLKASHRAGENEIIWDGRDANLQPVASGVYFYQLKADDKTLATERMVIIK